MNTVVTGSLFGDEPAAIKALRDFEEGMVDGDEFNEDLGQWMTPSWAAEELSSMYFGDLSAHDHVLEPSCGTGAFLAALPKGIPALGVEIDPRLAEQARKRSGHPVIVGDFLAAEIPFVPTAIIGNPPFKQALVQAFFERAWELLPVDGRVGFVLPCYVFQTASVVARLSQKWGMRQDLIPRNVFPRLHLPLCFAQLTKGAGRGMVGFALYHETDAVNGLRARYRAILAGGERSVWAAVVRAALECLGGVASLQTLYAEIQGHQPTDNQFWQAKVRQTVQRIAEPCGNGRWALPAAVAA